MVPREERSNHCATTWPVCPVAAGGALMFGSEFIQVALAVQVAFVSVLLLHALRRSVAQSRSRTSPAPTSSRRRPSNPARTADVADRSAAHGSTEAGELADLEMQRSRLLSDLERLRAANTREEADFRARRREVTLELHERRRISTELATAEPQLRDRVAALRTEVEHLERRRPELSAEIDASNRSSNVLRERVVIARRELEELHKDRERVGTRLETELQRLRDLACRRELLLAETEELAMLARHLQGVDGRTHLLSQVTDGDLRDRTHLRRLRGAGNANARADVTERTITLRSDDPIARLRERIAPQPDDTRAQAVQNVQ